MTTDLSYLWGFPILGMLVGGLGGAVLALIMFIRDLWGFPLLGMLVGGLGGAVLAVIMFIHAWLSASS